jgi:hypothetical protein
MNTLREMVDFASPLVADRFARHGLIYPMWHIVRGDGGHEIKTDVGPDKDTAAILMRAYFYLVKARRYLFIDKVERYAALGRLSEFPDRREAVMFSGEDINGDSIMGVRYILRPEHGKPTLAPLEIQDRPGVSYGRFVHMLYPEIR